MRPLGRRQILTLNKASVGAVLTVAEEGVREVQSADQACEGVVRGARLDLPLHRCQLHLLESFRLHTSIYLLQLGLVRNGERRRRRDSDMDGLHGRGEIRRSVTVKMRRIECGLRRIPETSKKKKKKTWRPTDLRRVVGMLLAYRNPATTDAAERLAERLLDGLYARQRALHGELVTGAQRAPAGSGRVIGRSPPPLNIAYRNLVHLCKTVCLLGFYAEVYRQITKHQKAPT